MSFIAPVLCFLLLYGLLRCMHNKGAKAIRTGALAWGALLVIITESLSAFVALTPYASLVVWLVIDFAIGIAIICRWPRRGAKPKSRRIPSRSRMITGSCVSVAAATVIIGLLSAPNNFDSMIYHLSRVARWESHRSTAIYPTNCLTQLYHQPWCEWAILQFQLLTNGDRLAFLVPWASMVGCAVISWSVARQLGGGPRAAVLAAALAITIPSGVLQAVTTQNNLPLAFWLLCGIDAILEFIGKREATIGASIEIGAAFGLAFLTKGTAGVYALPLLAWFTFEAMRKGFGRGLSSWIIAGVVALAIDAGHAVQNWQWCGSPVMPHTEMPYYRVDAMSPRLWLANASRNAALHFNSRSNAINRTVEKAVARFDNLIGIGVEDSRITFPGDKFFIPRSGHEDTTGAPLMVILLIVAFGYFLITPSRWRTARRRYAGVLLAASVLGFSGFCATVKWQPYHARLHLPLLMIAAAPCAIELARIRPRIIADLFFVVLFALAAVDIIKNPTHPLSGSKSIFRHTREEQYFVERRDLFSDYCAAADLLKDCHGTIGISTAGDGWEYPLWVFLHDRSGVWPNIISTPASAESPQPSKDDLRRLCGIVVLEPRMLPTALAETGFDWEIHRLKHLIVLTRATDLH